MRRAPRTDANQAEIVAALRGCLCTVESLAAIGGGVPDLLVGFRGVNYVLEVKDGSKPPSQRKLTSDELKWHRTWRGQRAVVYSVDDALRVVGIKEAR